MSHNHYSFSEKSNQHIAFNLLYITASKFEGELQFNPHTHHFTELFYIVSGQGEFIAGETRFSIKANDLVIINPHIEHTELTHTNIPLEYVAFGVEGITLTSGSDSPEQDYTLYHLDTFRDPVRNLLRMLLDELEAEHSNYEVFCRDIIEILLILLMRKQNLSLLPSLDTKMSKECGIVKRYLDANYMENVTLDQLAEITHMNKFYLAHSFTKYTGLSPISYLTQKRIRVSMDLLASTNHSIAQIASGVGFSSQSYFSHVFRKTLGITPVQYRKQNMNPISPLWDKQDSSDKDSRQEVNQPASSSGSPPSRGTR